jgi:hypothetical protein
MLLHLPPMDSRGGADRGQLRRLLTLNGQPRRSSTPSCASTAAWPSTCATLTAQGSTLPTRPPMACAPTCPGAPVSADFAATMSTRLSRSIAGPHDPAGNSGTPRRTSSVQLRDRVATTFLSSGSTARSPSLSSWPPAGVSASVGAVGTATATPRRFDDRLVR